MVSRLVPPGQNALRCRPGESGVDRLGSGIEIPSFPRAEARRLPDRSRVRFEQREGARVRAELLCMWTSTPDLAPSTEAIALLAQTLRPRIAGTPVS